MLVVVKLWIADGRIVGSRVQTVGGHMEYLEEHQPGEIHDYGGSQGGAVKFGGRRSPARPHAARGSGPTPVFGTYALSPLLPQQQYPVVPWRGRSSCPLS